MEEAAFLKNKLPFISGRAEIVQLIVRSSQVVRSLLQLGNGVNYGNFTSAQRESILNAVLLLEDPHLMTKALEWDSLYKTAESTGILWSMMSIINPPSLPVLNPVFLEENLQERVSVSNAKAAKNAHHYKYILNQYSNNKPSEPTLHSQWFQW